MRTDLYWIEGPWAGRLAIMPRPRGGDWLEDEIQAWRRTGVDVVVSLLTGEEIADLDLSDEAKFCRVQAIEFIGFPIVDRSVPPSREAFAVLVAQLAALLATGKNVAVHCRQGIGRAALVAICLLVLAGVDLETAVKRVAAARGCVVPETPEQRRWAEGFARSLSAPLLQ